MQNKISIWNLSKKVSLMFLLLTCTILFVGCNSKSNEEKLNITENDYGIISEYLDNKTGNSIVMNDGKNYSAFKILGTGKDEIYLWVLKENGSGGGASLPVLLNAKKENNDLTIIDYKIPRDGDQYVEDVKEIFPKNVQKQIFSDVNEHNAMVDELKKQIEDLKK